MQAHVPADTLNPMMGEDVDQLRGDPMAFGYFFGANSACSAYLSSPNTIPTIPTIPTTTAPPSQSVAVGQPLVESASGGYEVRVTVAQVIDPGSSDNQFETPTSGDRFVAVKIVFDDTGSQPVHGNANVEFTVSGSDGQRYSAIFAGQQGCTNLR